MGIEITNRPCPWDGAVANPYQRGETKRRNVHPTVKPVALMRWVSRLVCPPGGVIVDPFAGSGSGGIAALAEGFRWIGIELDAAYCEIARARIVGDAPLLNRLCAGHVPLCGGEP